MMEHLLMLGHREFALLTTPIGVATADDRVHGALQALEGTNGHATVISEKLSRETAGKFVERWMTMNPRPTAIFALNNLLTIGTLKALRARGFRVPEDVSLAGFDDLPAPLLEQPFLTVVSQPAYEIGKSGVELLMAEITDPSSAHRQVMLQPELVIRNSCGSPRTP